ncbi:MAG: TonB-dependent receptor [Proteobacteria bacterium]|nr:TonB-dependent receptor [Pseudomonadota bacterium]
MYRAPADTGIPIFPVTFDEDYDDDEFSYDLTGVINFNDSVNGYISYSHGYKVGGFNLDATAAIAGANPSFKSESIDSWEIGLKSDLFNRLLRANIAVWTYDIENYQVLDFTGIQLRTFNVPKAKSDGVEIELLASPMDGLELSAAYTYADTRYPSDCDGNDPNAPPQISSLCGSDLINSPKNSFTFGVSYDGYLGSNLRYFLGSYARWEDDRRTSVQPLPELEIQDANSKINLRAGIGSVSGSWMLELWGNNVTDEQTKNLLASTPLRLGSSAVWLEAPRTYGITLRTRF